MTQEQLNAKSFYYSEPPSHWPGLFAAGLLCDGWADLLLSVRFVFDWQFFLDFVFLRGVCFWPHSLWALDVRALDIGALDIGASYTVGSLSFSIWTLLLWALTPLPPLLLRWWRHRVLLSRLLGNQLGVDPGFPVDGIAALRLVTQWSFKETLTLCRITWRLGFEKKKKKRLHVPAVKAGIPSRLLVEQLSWEFISQVQRYNKIIHQMKRWDNLQNIAVFFMASFVIDYHITLCIKAICETPH